MARILVADDDAAMRDLVKRALELDGHIVVTAEDGTDAETRLLAEGRFDVIVTDIQMPGIDGLTLVRSALVSDPRMKALLMSAHADVLDKARGMASATTRLVAKPFSIDRLRAEVRALAGA